MVTKVEKFQDKPSFNPSHLKKTKKTEGIPYLGTPPVFYCCPYDPFMVIRQLYFFANCSKISITWIALLDTFVPGPNTAIAPASNKN